MKVDILGTKYNIIFTDDTKDARLIGNGGVCDFSTKELLIDGTILKSRNNPAYMGNLPYVVDKVVRHEIIHAFLDESGLEMDSRNEMIVDWIAIQFPKLLKAFKQVGVVKDE